MWSDERLLMYGSNLIWVWILVDLATEDLASEEESTTEEESTEDLASEEETK